MTGLRRWTLRRLALYPQLRIWLNALPATTFLAIFVLLPMALMVLVTFSRSSVDGIQFSFTLDNYRKLFSDETALRLLFKSIRISVTVTLLILILGYPLAYFIARQGDRYKYLLLFLVFIPYWISYVIRTYAWYPILGKQGALNQFLMLAGLIDQPLDYLLFNEYSVHLGLFSVFLPYAVVPIYLSLDRINPMLLEAAADLGARPGRSFWHVVLPLSLPGVLSGALMVFILTVGSYVTPQLLGGPSGIMMGNVIADQFGATFNWVWGGTLSLVLMITTLLAIWLVGRWVNLSQVFLGR